MRLMLVAAVVVVDLAHPSSGKAVNPQATELENYLALTSWTRDASPVAAGLAEGIDDWLSFGDGLFLRQVLRRCPTLRRLPNGRADGPAAIRVAHEQLVMPMPSSAAPAEELNGRRGARRLPG